jgi:hypothetical protein
MALLWRVEGGGEERTVRGALVRDRERRQRLLGDPNDGQRRFGGDAGF